MSVRGFGVVAALLVLAGCASTFGETDLVDFNNEYGKTNAVSPKYKLSSISDSRYSIALHQGEILISDRSVRHSLLKIAGLAVAEDTCVKNDRSLAKFDWQPHGDSGWLHVTADFECRSSQTTRNNEQEDQRRTPRNQSTTGSGFFVSRFGHVVTNAHVVNSCNSMTVGDSAKKQLAATLVSSDKRNDLALLQIKSLEMASQGTKSLIRNLGINIVPLAGHGLLRLEDVRLGEDVLVAGFPFGDAFSDSIKATKGIVSSVRGIGDNSGQFQMDAAVQPGNSGGPVYDENANIVGVVIAQLNKLKVAKAMGSLPENVNFAIKASTVRQFLTSSGLPSRWSTRSKKMPNWELAKIAQKQTLMVMCHR